MFSFMRAVIYYLFFFLYNGWDPWPSLFFLFVSEHKKWYQKMLLYFFLFYTLFLSFNIIHIILSRVYEENKINVRKKTVNKIYALCVRAYLIWCFSAKTITIKKTYSVICYVKRTWHVRSCSILNWFLNGKRKSVSYYKIIRWCLWMEISIRFFIRYWRFK